MKFGKGCLGLHGGGMFLPSYVRDSFGLPTTSWWFHLRCEVAGLQALSIHLDVVVIVFRRSLEEVEYCHGRSLWKVRHIY